MRPCIEADQCFLFDDGLGDAFLLLQLQLSIRTLLPTRTGRPERGGRQSLHRPRLPARCCEALPASGAMRVTNLLQLL